MDEGKRLASFVSELRCTDLSEEVVERTKDLVLDQIGIELATSTKPWGLAVLKYVRSFCSLGESTIIGYGDKVKAENAAFVNGTFGHGFEMDDTYQEKLDGARGTPVNPITRGEVEDKFRDLATVVLSRSQAEEVIKLVEDLDGVRSISALCKLLVS